MKCLNYVSFDREHAKRNEMKRVFEGEELDELDFLEGLIKVLNGILSQGPLYVGTLG